LNEKLGLQYLDIAILDDNDLVSGFGSKKSTPIKTEVKNEVKPIAKDEITLKIEEYEKQINDPNTSSRIVNVVKRKLKELKAQRESRPLPMNLPMKSTQISTKQVITEQPQNSSKIVIESVIDPLKAFEDNIDWPFQMISTTLMNDLFNAKWEIRHGAAIGLRSILKKQGSGAGKKKMLATPSEIELMKERGETDVQKLRNQRWLEDCVVKLLCVLGLDRFADYSSPNVIFPVRETVAQVIATVSKLIPDSIFLILSVFSKLQQQTGQMKWEIRHGAFVGVKYLAAIWQDTEDISIKILQNQFVSLIGGLKDLSDDIRLVSSESLVPMVPILVKHKHNEIPIVLQTVWDTLLEIDETSESTSSVTRLLSDISTSPGLILEDFPNFSGKSLINLIPRLFPFFTHSIISVRMGVLTTVKKFCQFNDVSLWISPILGNLVRLLFQMIVLDKDKTTSDNALDLWSTLFESLNIDLLQTVCLNFLSDWVMLMLTNNNQTIGKEKLLRIHHSSLDEDHTYICEKPIGDIDMQIRCAKALGIVARVWKPLQIFDAQGQPLMINHFHCYFEQLLFSNKAIGIMYAAVTISSYITALMNAQQKTGVQQIIDINPLIINQLLTLVNTDRLAYYEEVGPTLKSLHDDTITLINSFLNLNVSVQGFAPTGAMGEITISDAQRFVTQFYPHLITIYSNTAKLNLREKNDNIDKFNARKNRVENRVRTLEELQRVLNRRVTACVSEAIVQLGARPDSIEKVSNILLDSVINETDDLLRQRFSDALALLLNVENDNNISTSVILRISSLLLSNDNDVVMEGDRVFQSMIEKSASSLDGGPAIGSKKRKNDLVTLSSEYSENNPSKKTTTKKAKVSESYSENSLSSIMEPKRILNSTYINPSVTLLFHLFRMNTKKHSLTVFLFFMN